MADIRINSLPSTATSFNTDDYIAIDGASGGTRKMLAATLPLTDVTLGGSSGPSVKSTLSARAPRQGLVFNGSAATPSTIANIPAFGQGTAGSSAGDFTLSAWINTSDSGSNTIFGANSTGSGKLQLRLNSFNIQLLQAATSLVGASTSAVPSGKTALVTYTRAANSGTFYINGVSAGTITDGTNWSTAVATIGVSYGTDERFNGSILTPLIYNRALSASEVVALYEAGAPAGADYNSASNTNLTSAGYVNQDFTTFTASGTTGFTATNTTGGARYAKSNADFSIVQSGKVRLFYDLSGTGTVYARLGKIGVANYSDLVTLTAGTGKYVDLTATATASNCTVLFMSQGSTDNFTIANSTAVRIGLLLAPDAAQAGGGLVWYDTSGNAANITLPASGVSWNVPTSGYWGGNLTVSGTASVTGQINGSAGYQFRAASGTTYELLRYVGGTNNPGIFTTVNESTKKVTIFASGSLVSGQTLGLGAEGSEALTLGAANATLSGNLTVSGTGNSSVAGTLLVATTTNSSNGKIQLATHTTSAGGIGFGTDNSIYRAAAGTLYFDGNGTTALLNFSLAGLGKAQIGIFGGNTYFDYQGSLLVRYGGTTALTLDSSQNATFNGGTVTLGDYAGDQDVIIAAQSTGVGYLRWRPTASGTNAYGFSIAYDNPNNKLSFLRHEFSTAGTEWLSVARATGVATFANAIAIGNTVQTAAAVASTHKVTISIGGVTYYLLATNV